MESNSIEEKKARVGKLIIELLAIPSDKRMDEIAEELDCISPDPEWSSYIYFSDEFCDEDGKLDDEALTALVEKIFSYKPIQL